MKKWLPLFLMCLITFITLTPKVGIFAYTENDYYNAIGSYYLANMLISGDSTELDFSQGDGDEEFLIAIGEALVTGDYNGLAQWGLNTLDDAITDIKEFVQTSVYNINPDIYDFLYSNSNVKINLSDGHITKNLFVELQNSLSPTPTPTPDVDYLFYIDIINGSGFWWKDWPNKNYYNANKLGMDSNSYPPNKVSWISNYNNYSYLFTPTASREQYCNVADIQNIYITSSNNVYYVNYTILNSRPGFYYNDNPGYNGIVYRNQTFALNTVGNNPDGTIMQYSGSLTEVFSWLSYRFRNVNIYVDGVPWSIVGSSDNTKPVEIGNNLTIFNNYPAQYYYPNPIYFDMNGLITRIITAIQQKDVITYSDIEDLIYDVNGNLAIGTVNFARTDYDVLASEQIPYYPKFYYDNNLNQYVQAGANMINISTEILPSDVLNILITSGVILLFGYVIRRLLE